MAIKTRPKGSYKQYSQLTASEVENLSTSELRGIVEKLNDAANKRIRRLRQSGLEEFSYSYRGRFSDRGKGFFSLSRKNMTTGALRKAYLSVRKFLEAKGTTLPGVRQEFETQSKMLEKAYGDDIFDKRFKGKVLKKGQATKNKVSRFWREYDKYKEIKEGTVTNDKRGTTDINDVEEFVEDLFSQGKTDLSDYEAKAREIYEENERRNLKRRKGNVRVGGSKPRRKKIVGGDKYTGIGRFVVEEIRVFDDDEYED